MSNIFQTAKETVISRLKKEGLLEKPIFIKARVLSAQEAIGNPEEYDFPLLKGKEKIVETNFQGNLGHAFTDMYGGFQGSLEEVFKMPSSNNYRRALQVASINALARYWGLVENTVHCKDEQPKNCAIKSCEFIQKNYPRVKRIAFIGYQPAFVDIFSRKYKMKVLDLDDDNIGKEKFGNLILDGSKDMEGAVSWSDLVIATGSTLVNNTIDEILALAGKDKVIFYGVTLSGTAVLLGLNRICFT